MLGSERLSALADRPTVSEFQFTELARALEEPGFAERHSPIVPVRHVFQRRAQLTDRSGRDSLRRWPPKAAETADIGEARHRINLIH